MDISDFYTPWSHYRDNKDNSAPIHTDGLTVGLEVELGESHDDLALYNMVEDGCLETKDSGRANIQLEYEAQSDVEYELVFNGDYIDEIKSRLDLLDEYEVFGAVTNHHECSAHVHISRLYIEDLGLDEYDVYKATEWLAPFIYAISGRDNDAWEEWTPSRIDRGYSLITRADYVDDVQPKSYRGCGRTSPARYDLCNLANENTIEIRGFSSYFKSVSLIKTYLDVVADLIPSIALALKGKSYKTDHWRAIKELNEFLDAHEALEQTFDLRAFRYDHDAIHAYAREKAFDKAISVRDSVREALKYAHNYGGNGDIITGARYVLDALELDKELSVEKLPLTRDALLSTIDDLKDQEARLFKNRIWSA